MAIIENRSTEIGDVMRIESDVPVVGIVTLNNYVDDIQGEQIIDGAVVPINLVTLSQDLSGIASFDGSSVSFLTDYTNGEVGVLELQKNELEVGKTYKLAFTVRQNTDAFGKLNLYHSSTTAIIQYSQVQVGIDVNVICLITPTTNDADNNKNLRINISNIEVNQGDSIVFTNFALNEVSTTSRYFKKEFRYSTDGGLNFTNWMDLNNVNVQGIVVSRRDLFVTEIKLTRQGLNATGELVFNSLNIGGIYKELPYKIYGKTIFNDFFTVNDVGVIGWQLNVLEKLYKEGIMPWYMERDTGEEYLIGQPILPQTYTVTVDVTDGTSSIVSEEVEEGGNIVITLTPNIDKYLDQILVNGQLVTNYNVDQNKVVTLSVLNIQEDKQVSATFIDIPNVGYLYNLRAALPIDTNKSIISDSEWKIPALSDMQALRDLAITGVPYSSFPPQERTLLTHNSINNQVLPVDSYTNKYNFSAYFNAPCILASESSNTYQVFPQTRYMTTGKLFYLVGGNLSLNTEYPASLVRLNRNLRTGESTLPNGTILAETYTGNDLKEYKTVKIGSSVWLAEDLKETKYVDGTIISEFMEVLGWQEYHKTASPILGAMIKVTNIAV